MNKKQKLQIDNDALGRAYISYLQGNKKAHFTLHSSDFDPDEIPVSHFFRTFSKMPKLEQRAILECKGSILDVGAGSGTHSLELQKRGFDVTAMDISPLACEVMKLRGVNNCECVDFFTYADKKFDTILLLMNGIGIIQTASNFPAFFSKISELLNPGGQILLDSSDLKYLFENEDGSFDIPLNAEYFGQVDFEVEFNGFISEKFEWVYVDFDLLQFEAEKAGFNCSLIMEGTHYDYLACLKKIS